MRSANIAGATLWLMLGAALAAPASAQGVIRQPNLSLALAKTIAETALAACEKIGAHTSVAVVDRTGQTMVLLRHEAATPTSGESAMRKAYTARVFRRPSLQWAQDTRDNPAIVAQRDLDNVLALGGGVPIKVGDDTIGAVASAGGPGPDKDEACAKAGIDAVADLLK